jgi:DNA-binding response OmpR family regulator
MVRTDYLRSLIETPTESNVVAVMISRIRKKLRDIDSSARIANLSDTGYILEPIV